MKVKPNVFVIDTISEKVVEVRYSKTPSILALEIASGYLVSGSPKIQSIPTKNYPNRFGIETGTDFIIHFFK